MAYGQSIIVAFIASEVAGSLAEHYSVNPKDVRYIKCAVSLGIGTITAIATADPVGTVGSMALGAVYIGGHNPLPLVASAFNLIRASASKGYSNDS